MSSVLFRFTEPPGLHAVGLKVIEQYDRSRIYRRLIDECGEPFLGERARPLQTLIWYPAEISVLQPMTVGDYVDLWDTERSFGEPQTVARAKEWRAGMTATLSTPLWAVRGAREAGGHYPVVIYVPGNGSPSWENADLCEYLASHGYVVIATPSMGASTAYPTIDLAGIDPQARDISFLIGYAETLPNADTSQVAAAGFSWGGIANVFAAARDNRIKALIALDGSLRFSPGLVWAGGIQPEEMTIPLLSIAQGLWTPEEKASVLANYTGHDGPDVLNAWTGADLVSVLMLGFTHAEHSSMAQRNEDVMTLMESLFRSRKVDYGRADGVIGYAWLARYTLQFLNAYLKHDEIAGAFLKKTPVQNGVPPRLMTADFRARAGTVLSLETLRVELNRLGFDRITEIYARFQNQNAKFKLDEHEISAWAQQLIDGNHLAQAIAVLKLNVYLNPDSGEAHMSLGRVYHSAGHTQLALETFRRVLKIGRTWEVAQASRALEALKPESPN